MAVTSIWRVNGWLGKVVVYVKNPEKTTNPEFYENGDMTERECQGLEDVISYAVSSHKTQQVNEELDTLERFVSGINCNPSTAREEMIAVKKRFGKEDGTIAYHGYQSFALGEATPEMAHKIGVELAHRLWGDRYQVVVATHLDKANHLHSHFVLNTVSFGCHHTGSKAAGGASDRYRPAAFFIQQRIGKQNYRCDFAAAAALPKTAHRGCEVG